MRRLIPTAFIFICFLSAQATAQNGFFSQSREEATEIEITVEELADRLVEYAASFLGTPYRYGANGPSRFDCTAYTRYVYRHFGYDDLSRSSKDQARDGREVDISDFSHLQKGDILLLGSRRNPRSVGHVGIFIGLDSTGTDPKFIHASNSGVRYSSIRTETYYSNRLLGARRILPDFRNCDSDFDTAASYVFNPGDGARITPDSLVLADNDKRIVLFENGKWAYVGPDGTLVVPKEKGRIILNGDGNWSPVREARVSVPAASLKRESGSRMHTEEDMEQMPAAEPEKIYHTVVQGDTLSKIARKYGTTVDKICRLNDITSSTILKIGRKLRVK